MLQYRVELYRDNEGRKPDTYHLVEYQNEKPNGSALSPITTDKTFAERITAFLNSALANPCDFSDCGDAERIRKAAPQMLEALKEIDRLLRSIEQINVGSPIHEQIRAVIAAATTKGE